VYSRDRTNALASPAHHLRPFPSRSLAHHLRSFSPKTLTQATEPTHPKCSDRSARTAAEQGHDQHDGSVAGGVGQDIGRADHQRAVAQLSFPRTFSNRAVGGKL
jgi:hypothetical protein